MDGDALAGYLYVVLGGEKYDSVAGMVSESLIVRLSLFAGGLGLMAALAAGMLSFAWLTRRLRRLTQAVDRFRDDGFESPMKLAGWRRGGDEIDRLGVTVEEMSQRIADQIEQLRQADAARRDMVANISHDLRTPLASLQGYLETLLMKEDSFSAEEKRKYIDLAARQGDRLSRLVTELFELTMLDSTGTRLNFEPFSLPELVQDVTQKFQPQAERRNMALELDMPASAPFVRADIGLIERVLENLIENAIKYTPEGGKISLSSSPAPTALRRGSPTPAPAFPRPTATASSSASTGSKNPVPTRRKAPGWGWRSPGAFCSSMTARSRWKAPRPWRRLLFPPAPRANRDRAGRIRPRR